MSFTTVQLEENNKKQGAVEVGNAFTSKGIRHPEAIVSLQVGDVLRFPDPLKVMQIDIRGTSAQYVVVEIVDGPNKGSAINFFPGMFCKSATYYNEPTSVSAAPMPVIPYKTAITGGTAAIAFRNTGDVAPGMALIAGKDVVVTKATPVRTSTVFRSNIHTEVIYDYNFVEDKK